MSEPKVAPAVTSPARTVSSASKSLEKPRRARPEEFIFGKLIGEGSYSCVFLAKEISSQREFAIKVCEKRQILQENKAEYIHREKEIMVLLSDFNERRPYFVQLFSTFQDTSRLYFVISYAKNGDLLRLINRLSTNDESSNAADCARFYAAELVAAVEYMHERGVIHRDLKPENILLNEKLHILITDFGSAKIVRNDGNRVRGERQRRRTGDNREGEKDSDADTSGENDNDCSDDASEPPVPKRRSFVGTPQYVSPEILRSFGSSRASDLWAIGCIIYQLMTGLPPFQSQTEFLIFKKIEKLDYSFHEGFNEDAKNLVQQLLVIEPQNRLGAQDSVYYTSLRRHPFFNGIDFDRLPETTPPSVGMLPQVPEGQDPCWKKCPDAKPGADRIPLLMVEDGTSSGDDDGIDWLNGPELVGHSSQLLVVGNPGAVVPKRSNSRRNKPTIEHLSDEERRIRLEDQAKNNDFHRFVEGHLIVKQGILYKKKGFFPKKRMFLLTEGPHLYYVDPDKMVLKGEIPWSPKLRTEIRDFRVFFVHVPGRTYYLIDHDSRAKDWCEALEEVIRFYYEDKHEV